MKAKWKIVAGATIALGTLFMLMLRSQNQKEVLDAANRAHRDENRANDKARKDLAAGLAQIEVKKDVKESIIVSETKEKEVKLKEEKAAFLEETKKTGTLVSDLAKHLGAEVVDAKDE